LILDISNTEIQFLGENGSVRSLSSHPFTVSSVRSGGYFPATTWNQSSITNYAFSDINFNTDASNINIMSIKNNRIENYKESRFDEGLLINTYTPSTTTSRLYNTGSNLYWDTQPLSVWDESGTSLVLDACYNELIIPGSTTKLGVDSGNNKAYLETDLSSIEFSTKPGSTILRIKDDATNTNPTLQVYNTNTSNSECSIQFNHPSSASYTAKFGVDSSGQATIYSNTDRIQQYINGGTALTLINSASNNLSFTPNAWSAGSNHYFGLGGTDGNATLYGRYFTFSHSDGMRYYTDGGRHEFNYGGTPQCYIDTNGIVSSNSLNTYPYVRITASNSIIEHRRFVGDIWYAGPDTSSNYKISNIPAGGYMTLDRVGNMYITDTYYGSDRRIKKDIELIKDDEALQIIKKIEPKTYKYIDQRTRGDDTVYGFIAQEVRAVFPPAVKLDYHAIPTILQWFDISGDVITFNTAVDISENTQIQVVELSGEIIDVSGNTGSKVDIGDIWVVKQLAFNKYQVNQQINYEKGYCIGPFIHDFHTLNKEKLIPILWSAIQEQQRTIEKQQELITNQELEITQMKQRLAQIEQLLSANGIK
jgi:hypothetical protein